MAARIDFTRGARRALLATAAVPLMIAVPAIAQDTAPASSTQETPADDAAADVIVTGIRQTLQTSIQQKKLETAIVDTLSSNEIGDLPALSVGEAIQTITGATTHREKGGASEIALRGLGSFLSNTTFNGRDASNGSGDRAVNFNQFPSELINGIKIYKSQQANLVEGGVAGTIELETLKPLDFNRRRLQAEIKTNYSPYQDRIIGSSAWGWRGTLSYVDQFDAGDLGRIGITFGAQRNKTNNPEETVAASSTWVACNPTIVAAAANCTEVTRAQAAGGTPFYLQPNAITYRQISEQDQRDAVFGAVQWQPSPTIDINLDVQYSKRDYSEDRSDLNLSETRFGLRNVVYDANHVVQSFTGLTSLEAVSTRLERNEEYLGGGGNIEWRASDRLTVSGDASYSRTIRTDVERSVRLRTDPFDIFNVRTPINNQRVPYTYEIKPGNFAPTITIDPRFNLNDPTLFSDDARFRRDELQRRNTIFGGRLDATYKLDGFLSSIALGGRFSRLTYNDYDDRVEVTQDDRPLDAAVNIACRNGTFPQTDFLKAARGNIINSYATFDLQCQFARYPTAPQARSADLRRDINRDVTENTYAGYIMGEYRGDIGSLPIRGNFGVRAVRTEVVSNGLRSDLVATPNDDGTIRLVSVLGSFQTVTIENSTTRFLPSINAVFEPRQDVQLRLAGYRGMSKPAPSALGAGRSFQLEDGTNPGDIADAIRQITANGSPRLQPLMSWNVDAAVEWYPNRDSIVAATVYKKWFTGGFIPVELNEDFTIGGQTLNVPVVQTQNSPNKSNVYGLELTLANRFSWLPAPLDGFGGKVSYNLAISDFENEDIRLGDVLDPKTGVVTPGMIPPANLSGYSKHVVSAQLYYQWRGLNLQGVYNYRSNYYQDFVGGNSQLRYVRGNETFDLRASYDISKAVRMQVEAVNIFDAPKVTDMPVQGSSRQYHYYGSRYFLGLRVRL